jgi:hypothetical protein
MWKLVVSACDVMCMFVHEYTRTRAYMKRIDEGSAKMGIEKHVICSRSWHARPKIGGTNHWPSRFRIRFHAASRVRLQTQETQRRLRLASDQGYHFLHHSHCRQCDSGLHLAKCSRWAQSQRRFRPGVEKELQHAMQPHPQAHTVLQPHAHTRTPKHMRPQTRSTHTRKAADPQAHVQPKIMPISVSDHSLSRLDSWLKNS